MSMSDKVMLAVSVITFATIFFMIGYMGGRQNAINQIAKGEIIITTNTSTTITYVEGLK